MNSAADGRDFVRLIRGVYGALGGALGALGVPTVVLLEPDAETGMYALSGREFVTVDDEGGLDGSVLKALEAAAASAREAHAQKASELGVQLCEMPGRKQYMQ